jgi:Mg-chelatase subunit ChlD
MALTPEEELTLKLLLKKKNSPKKVIHVIQVLDGSGSMQTGQDITISAYNENLNVLRDPQPDTKVTATLIKFNDKVKVLYSGEDADRAENLSSRNYVPAGTTALNDAIGQAFDLAEEKLERGSHVQYLLQIFTDGMENASTKYPQHRIHLLRERLSQLQETGKWTITVMGPRGSLDLFAEHLGVHRGNTVQFEASSIGSRAFARSVLNVSTANYMASAAAGATSVSDSYSTIAPDGNVESLGSSSNVANK